jgi:two-component system cell cycle sensor histidine kinase/response regulator CckA
MEMKKKPISKLLILEDNEDDIILLKEMVAEMSGYDFGGTTFTGTYLGSLEQGIRYLKSHPVDMILLDLSLPDSLGLRTLRSLRERQEARDIPIIILTALDDKETAVKAIKMGAQEYLVKGEVSTRMLCSSIRYATERQRLTLQLEKETEELRKEEHRFTEILSNDPDGVVIVDMKNRVLFANPEAERLLGQKPNALLAKLFEFPGRAEEAPAREIEIPGKKRGTITAEVRGVKIDWQGKEAWLISLRDITGKKKLLKAFAQEKELLDVTLRSIADGVIAVDETGVIRLINWIAGQMTGWPQQEAVGKALPEVLKLKDKTSGQYLDKPGEDVIKKGKTLEFTGTGTWALVSRDGSEIPIEWSCAPVIRGEEAIGSVMVIRDITEKQELEEELVRARSLEALGVLSAGIAHEYSNILTSTLGYISLAKIVLGEESNISRQLKKAEDAALRAKEISYRLFTFARGGEPRKSSGSLVKPLEQAVGDTIKAECPGIAVEWGVAPGLWPVSYDPDQLHLALKNILKNAAEAMGGSKAKGTLTITLENMKSPGIKSSTLKSENYVKASITDQGSGICGDHLPKIFDPYFSTKEKAEGMGLTTAYSIVRKHGGDIRVKAGENRGTTVILLLPALTPVPVPEPVPPVIPGIAKPIKASTLQKRKILVMDDEELVRDIAAEMLEFLEYEAVLAERGEEAIKLYRQAMEAGDPFAAVILDLVIPNGIGGKECMEKLRQLDPKVKAIVSSGYSDDPVVANYPDYGFQGVLPKPYKIHELSDSLEKLGLSRGKEME